MRTGKEESLNLFYFCFWFLYKLAKFAKLIHYNVNGSGVSKIWFARTRCNLLFGCINKFNCIIWCQFLRVLFELMLILLYSHNDVIDARWCLSLFLLFLCCYRLKEKRKTLQHTHADTREEKERVGKNTVSLKMLILSSGCFNT